MSTRDSSVVLILDSSYIVARSQFTNGTLHQVENHFNELSNIGYVFNRQNKQDVEDNRFQYYLLITDLLEAHVAALLETITSYYQLISQVFEPIIQQRQHSYVPRTNTL